MRVGYCYLPSITDLVAGAESGCRRSEEHTSELQSRLHLVCRLLLEKKKHSLPPSKSSVTSPPSTPHYPSPTPRDVLQVGAVPRNASTPPALYMRSSPCTPPLHHLAP